MNVFIKTSTQNCTDVIKLLHFLGGCRVRGVISHVGNTFHNCYIFLMNKVS